MKTYKEFKQAYKKFLLESQDVLVSEMVSCADDIPTDDISYKNAVIRAYVFLSNCKSRDIGHLKILTNYEKLMKKNLEAGMNITPVDFATVLFIFHQYCVRILRSPWRADFFTIKVYNGFYEYTLRKALAPSVIDDMMEYIGFRRNQEDSSFIFMWQNLDPSCVRAITDAGIGCFLSYTHCMAKNDDHFKKTVSSLTYLLQNSTHDETPTSLPQTIERSLSPEQPSTSRRSNQELRAEKDVYSMSAARERRREKRNTYRNDRPVQSASLAAQPTNFDLYGPQESPVDMSIGNGLPYNHRVKRISEDRQSNSSHGSGSVDLYGGSEPKSSSSDYQNLPAQDREIVAETAPERTGYSPPSSRRGPSTLNSQMEKFSVKDWQPDYERTRDIGKILLRPGKGHHSSYFDDRNINYVKFVPNNTATRGSPDGEMADEQRFDYPSTSHRMRTDAYHRDSKQCSKSKHIYHEIN